MTKDELITKQQLEIEHYKLLLEGNMEFKQKIIAYFVSIGQPLNDNKLQFSKEQLRWVKSVYNLVFELNTL